MARLGLGNAWKCLFANDISHKKTRSYRENFIPSEELVEADVFDLTPQDLPKEAVDMVWASFPCQDLSLAGNGRGLDGLHSGSFWGFWQLVESLLEQDRAPSLIVLENVAGAVTARKGEDFHILLNTLISAGYCVGPLMIDGALFVPQSRPRLFVVAVKNGISIPSSIHQKYADKIWHPSTIVKAFSILPATIKDKWVWWNLPYPAPLKDRLIDLLEDEPTGVSWHTKQQTQRLLELMSSTHVKRVVDAQKSGKKVVGTIYRRIRIENGRKVQRAEIRFDGISGCIRTGSGGSSKQIVMIIEGESVRSRLLSPREIARLMGIDDDYNLPTNYSDAYHLLGDGLVVPVVSWLSDYLLIPLLTPNWHEEEAYRFSNQKPQLRLLEKFSRVSYPEVDYEPNPLITIN